MNQPIYFDYAASTPVDERVKEVMLPYLAHSYGNPASLSHAYGKQAADAIENARQQIAAAISADPREIIWTSGATESNNLALKGIDYSTKRHIITAKTEHRAVLDVCSALATGHRGPTVDITYLDPLPSGLISPEAVANAIRPDTALVSLMAVNNETGVQLDLAEIGKLTREKGILFHVDGAQAIGKIHLNVENMNVDLLSLASHKAYGPKGVGALYVRRRPRVKLSPLIHGGGHERGLRSGTLPTHQIIGMGRAYEIANDEFNHDLTHITNLNQSIVETIDVQGKLTVHGENRVPSIINIGFAHTEMPSLLSRFSDFAIATGSACSSASTLFSNEPSHVLKAMHVDKNYLNSSIRISLGRMTTTEEVAKLITLLN